MPHPEYPVDNLDDRLNLAITERKFFEPFKAELQDLFTALGREDEWSDDPRNLVPYIREKWIGSEHGNSRDKDQFTDEQIEAAMPHLVQMGFAGEVLPEPGAHYDQTVVVGGTMLANYRRMQLTKAARDNGTDLGTEIWLVGQRPRDKRDGTNEEILGESGRFAGHDIIQNTWVQARAEQGAFEPSPETRDGWEFTETDTAIASLLKVVDPSLQPRRISLHVTDANSPHPDWPKRRPDAPARDITDYRYKTDDDHEIILINNAAVERKTGEKQAPSRHTTRSSTAEWLERYAPEEGARVLYVTGNPHATKTAQSTYDELQKMGRGDIRLEIAATVPPKTATIQDFLGSLGRLIDGDVKRNYQ